MTVEEIETVKAMQDVCLMMAKRIDEDHARVTALAMALKKTIEGCKELTESLRVLAAEKGG